MDNYHGDTFIYELHIYTGFEKDASTNSNVFITIYGTDGETGVRQLKDEFRTNVRTDLCNIFHLLMWLIMWLIM